MKVGKKIINNKWSFKGLKNKDMRPLLTNAKKKGIRLNN